MDGSFRRPTPTLMLLTEATMLRTLWQKLFGSNFSRNDRSRASSRNFVPNIETLEERAVPAGTWTPVTRLIPDALGAQSLLLLNDGTVMVQGGSDTASKAWYQLKPDATGSYTNGSWTPLKSMGLERLFFGSAVLQSGKVLVVGGEYSGPATANTETNTGEIYDPVANTWTNIPNVPTPGGDFGDGMLEVLPNGNVLGGYLGGTQTYIYNVASNSWSAGGAKLNNDPSSEEGWVKLSDSSILTYEIQGTAPQTGQRYIPSTNKWVAAGAVPVALDSNGGNAGIAPELGPALRLPDGRVFWTGASNHTALYNPATGTWTAGPNIPGGLGGFDAPAAMMPNGKVLMSVGVIDGNNFPPPTSLFEYDPTTNAINAVTAPPAPLATALNNAPVFTTRLMVLPSGQILLADSTKQLWVYTPTGAPAAAWRPTISSVTPNGGNTYTLTGTQLNGLSEGSTYGDDAQNATNYPIVRVTNPVTGVVTYARTFNWSSTGVGTGGAQVSTQFTLPAGFVLNETMPIVVIANGIPSQNFFASLGNSIKLYYPLRYAYNPVNGTYTGSLMLVNTGAGTPSSITLTFPKTATSPILLNPTGYNAQGKAYIRVTATLRPKSSLLVPIVLLDPFRINLSTFFIGFPITLS